MPINDALSWALPEFGLRNLNDRYSWSEEGQSKQNAQRKVALSAVLRESGFEGILTLARRAKNPPVVGDTLGELTAGRFENEVFPALLGDDDDALARFAIGFARVRIHSDSTAIARSFDGWSVNQITIYVLLLPFEERTWQRVEEMDEPVPTEYWRRVKPRWHLVKRAACEHAVRKLIAAERTNTVIEALSYNSKDPEEELEEATSLALLLQIAQRPSLAMPHWRMDGECGALIERLAGSTNTMSFIRLFSITRANGYLIRTNMNPSTSMVASIGFVRSECWPRANVD